MVDFVQHTQRNQLFHCHQKSSSSEKRLSLNETKHGQGELVDHNVLLNKMLSEVRTCIMGFTTEGMALLPWKPDDLRSKLST